MRASYTDTIQSGFIKVLPPPPLRVHLPARSFSESRHGPCEVTRGSGDTVCGTGHEAGGQFVAVSRPPSRCAAAAVGHRGHEADDGDDHPLR